MKKVLFTLAAILGLSLALVATSCGGGGGSDDDNETPVAEVETGGFVPVPGATFDGTTGITGSEVFIEGRTINIPSLWACDHEVTQAEYQSVMGANPSHFSGANRPVEYVSWYDAIMYCNRRSDGEGRTPCYKVNGNADTNQWGYTPHADNSISGSITCDFNANGYRLPTEAEWEYLARGGSLANSGQTDYSGSNEIGDVAWYNVNAYYVGSSSPNYGTHQVKTKDPNGKTLYDMSGNVCEWCWDWWSDTISAGTPSTGAASGSTRVLRGGMWWGDASFSAVSYRGSSEPYFRGSYCDCGGGFRVVCSRSE